MFGQPLTPKSTLKRAWELWRDPVTPEKRRLLAARWEALPPGLRSAGQGLGRQATGCGATIGLQPRCDFSCTGCYLGAEANRVPPLPIEAVRAQLEALRRYLGPKSNVQITDGEATLRPVGELLEILLHARSLGIIPMLMTHGDALRRKPGLLERLMREGGLTEISIHVDSTQRGRDGYRAPRSELELMPLRDELAERVRSARRSTGRPLRATSQNLRQVPEVVAWLLRNRDAFGLVSFQPVAQVGRTRKGLAGTTVEALWAEIAKAVAPFGPSIQGSGHLRFGHPECTRILPLVTLERSDGELRLFEPIRDRVEDAAILEEYFARGLGGVAFRDDGRLETFARALGLIRAAPGFLLGRVRRWLGRRLTEEAGTSMPRLAGEILLGRVRLDGFTITSHHFMNAEEIRTERGRERLDACVFRLPFEGEMVPMCRINADGLRERFYAGIRAARPEGPALQPL
jgi:hypothetical protein